MTMRVIHGDCLQVIPQLVAEGIVVDAVVCDPPYHLVPTQKRFGAANSAPAQHGRDGAMARLSAGFMGSRWDGGDIAFRPETWATVATILRPGAFLVAFGGTRTYHRLTCAIEDAGFVIQDSIIDLIGSDARLQRLVATLTPDQTDALSQILDDLQPGGTFAWTFGTGFPKRKDALKPAFEPIVLAYKPGGKRTLQVEECRIGEAAGDYDHPGDSGPVNRHDGRERYRLDQKQAPPHENGRWPANICHDGSDEVVACFEQFGERQSGDASIINSNGYDGLQGGKAFARAPTSKSYRGANSGSAARFFFSAKAGQQDRWGSRHPTVKPVELLKWLVSLVTPPSGTALDPFAGSGTTAVAALATGRDCILIERDDTYIADIKERLAFYEGGGMHSAAAKNRNRKRDDGPLFDMREAAE